MAMTFAGVRLCLETEEVADFLSQYHPVDEFEDASVWNFASYGIDHLPLPAPPEDGKFEIGKLSWPTGMSRCAVFRGLVDSVGLASIRTALGTGSAGPADLVMEDQSGVSRTFSLYFISARPIFQITGRTQLYLLTLSDARYFLREKVGSVSATPVSWSALFTTLASALGVTLTVETVDSDYSVPTDRWKLYDKSLSVLVDAAANAVGQRVVANLDGTYKTVSYATASVAADAQSDQTKTAGGLLVAGDLQRPVPASVNVLFAQRTSGYYQPDPYVVNKTLASLALTGFGTATGVSGQSASVIAELAYTGSNAAACASYATQAATDWYNWQLVNLDVTYPSVVEWTPTGAEDRIEWKHFVDRILTRVVRGPFQTFLQGGWEGGTNSAGQPPQTPLEPTEDTVPSFTTDGDLQNTVLSVNQYTQNGDPASTFTIYAFEPHDGDTPFLQFVQEVDSDTFGTPQQYVNWYPAGSNGTNVQQFTATPDIIQQIISLASQPVTFQFTSPSANVLQFVMGDPTGPTGLIYQFTVDAGTGVINQFVQSVQVGTSSTPVQRQYTQDGTATKETVTGEIDFSGATVTGLSSGGRTEGTLTATGSTQGTAAAIVTDAVVVSGSDGTKGVRLPNTAAALIAIQNDDPINALQVYPNTGASITSSTTAFGTNAAAPQGAFGLYARVSATQWYVVRDY